MINSIKCLKAIRLFLKDHGRWIDDVEKLDGVTFTIFFNKGATAVEMKPYQRSEVDLTEVLTP